MTPDINLNPNTLKNNFSYTNVTYQDIISKVATKFSESDKFRHLQESDIAPMLIELFAGLQDLTNYNIERTAEESFLSTAKRYRSATKLSGNLGYDIKRPTPAKATIKFVLTGTSALNTAAADSSDFVRNKVIIIPKNTDFIYDGMKFVLSDDIIYQLSDKELNQIRYGGTRGNTYFEISEIQNMNSTKIIPTVIQGSIRVMEFKGKENKANISSNGLGKSFQKYYVDDPQFSNFYGEYDIFGGDTTMVGVGQSYNEAFSQNNRYTIKRKSLIDARDMKTSIYGELNDLNDYYTEQSLLPKNVWVKTSAEVGDGKGVEIKFGDGLTTARGIEQEEQSVYVQYLATNGKQANRSGVINQELRLVDSNNKLAVSNQYVRIQAYFTSNIHGGSDIESIESIKSSAPGMFQTFDRLITKEDYTSFLKSLTSPIEIKNAIAWGENDEINNSQYLNDSDNEINTYKAIRKLFNVVLYTCIGSLYENKDGIMSVKKDMYNAILDNYNGNYIYPSQNYITIMAQKEVVKQLKFNNYLTDGSIPIENFKFNIEFEPLKGYIYSSFSKFFAEIAYPKFIKPINTTNIGSLINTKNKSTLTNANIKFCGIPTAISWELDNIDSDNVKLLKSDSNYYKNIWNIGSSLDINVNINDFITSVNTDVQLDLNSKKTEFMFDLFKTPEFIPYRIVKHYNTTTDKLEDIGEQLTQLNTNSTTLFIGGYDKLYIKKDYAFDVWKKIIETTWDDKTKPLGITSGANNNIYVDKKYGYTPWGYVANELEDILNNSIKFSLIGKDMSLVKIKSDPTQVIRAPYINYDDLSEYEKTVYNFKFINLEANIESEYQDVTDFYKDSYLKSMINVQRSNDISVDLNKLPGIKYVKSYTNLENTITSTSFPLVIDGNLSPNKYIISKAQLLTKLVEIAIDNSDGKLKYVNISDKSVLPSDDPFATTDFIITNYELNTNLQDSTILNSLFTKTINAKKYTLDYDSILYVIDILHKIQQVYDDYILTCVSFRSGENFTSFGNRSGIIQFKGNYKNIFQSYKNNASLNYETNYSSFKPKVNVNWNYFDAYADKFNETKCLGSTDENNVMLDWVRDNTTSEYTSPENNPILLTVKNSGVLKPADLQNIYNYYDWVAAHLYYNDTGISYSTSGNVINVERYTAISDRFKSKSSKITDVIGINNIGFYGYYPPNDVNVIDSLYSDKITIVNDSISQKNSLTVKSIYISPIIHEFQLWGTIYLKDLTYIDKVKTKITNSLYSWLDINNDFNKNINCSQLIDIIQSVPEVSHTNIKLLPYNSVAKINAQKYYFDITAFKDQSFMKHYIYSIMPNDKTKQKFYTIVMECLTKYITDHEINTVDYSSAVGPIPFGNKNDKESVYSLYDNELLTSNNTGDKKHILDWKKETLASNVTERTFLNELCKSIIDQCEYYGLVDVNNIYITRNKLFFMLLAELHNDFKAIIGFNMLNSFGDVAPEYDNDVLYKDGTLYKPLLRGGYSLTNEIIQITLNTDFKYTNG